MSTLSAGPPREIETARLQLRCWQPADAPALFDAIAASVEELRSFTPWVIPEPFEIAILEERLTRFAAQFDAREHFIYGVFEREGERVLGSAGLYDRVGSGVLEVGYWIRSDATGRGFATEAAAALTAAAFSLVERVALLCEPANRASIAIAQRLGFTLCHVRAGPEPLRGGEVRELMTWEQRRQPSAG